MISESTRRKIAYLRSRIFNYKGLPEDVFYFKRKKIIFIHIPKAAGISLYKAFFKRDSFGHETIRHYEDFMSAKEFKQCYKFTFVRNPYDRIHSAYYYLKAGGRGRPYDVEYSNLLLDINSFEEFVLTWLKTENIYNVQHFTPQTFYLKNKKNEINFDFIGKFENLVNDFVIVADKLKIDKELHFLNKTKVSKADYKEEYSRDMIKIIDILYHEDFENFGYKKLSE